MFLCLLVRQRLDTLPSEQCRQGWLQTYLIESFYRRMRKQYDILMVDEKTPFGERWNFDADNRNRYDGAVPIPEEEWPIKSDQSKIDY